MGISQENKLMDEHKILQSEKEENRREFQEAMVRLFDSSNPALLKFHVFISRTLLQFKLHGVYTVEDVILKAYVRGVRQIDSGKRIDHPLAWMRCACYNSIREYGWEQQRLSKQDVAGLLSETLEVLLDAVLIVSDSVELDDKPLPITRILQICFLRGSGEFASAHTDDIVLGVKPICQRGAVGRGMFSQLCRSVRDSLRKRLKHPMIAARQRFAHTWSSLVHDFYEGGLILKQLLLGEDQWVFATAGGGISTTDVFRMSKGVPPLGIDFQGGAKKGDVNGGGTFNSNDDIDEIDLTVFDLLREYRRLEQLPELSDKDARSLATILELAQHDGELAALLDKTDAELMLENQVLREESCEGNTVHQMTGEVGTTFPLSTTGVQNSEFL